MIRVLLGSWYRDRLNRVREHEKMKHGIIHLFQKYFLKSADQSFVRYRPCAPWVWYALPETTAPAMNVSIAPYPPPDPSE